MHLNKYIDNYFSSYNIIISHEDKLVTTCGLRYIKTFPQVKTPCYKTKLYDYLKSIIYKAIIDMNESDKKLQEVKDIIDDYELTFIDTVNNTNLKNHNKHNLIEIINSKDFYGTDDLIEIIYPKKEYTNYPDYIEFKTKADAKIPINSVQYYDNLLFEQKLDSNKINYYFYFSFGTLKNFEFIEWDNALDIYIEQIKKILENPNLNHLILAGHSMGSIIIQYIARKLINLNLQLEKIYLIGSGCRLNNLLTIEELNKIKSHFESRYYFVSSAYYSDGKIYYDHKSNDSSNTPIEITTNLLLIEGDLIISEELKFISCSHINFSDKKILDKYGILVPNPNIVLHDFNTYSKMYFTWKKQMC